MRNHLRMTPKAQAAFERVAAAARPELHALPERDRTVFVLRLKRYWQDLFDGLVSPYAGREDFGAFLESLTRLLATSYAARPEELKILDLERNLTPDWFQSEERIGYVFYADRFAGDLKGVAERLDHLEDLGANYVHMMPLLKSRPAPNDGGYAVADYRAVEPSLGTMEDLQKLCALFRERGMSPCLDLVLNHCAREHEWAGRAARVVGGSFAGVLPFVAKRENEIGSREDRVRRAGRAAIRGDLAVVVGFPGGIYGGRRSSLRRLSSRQTSTQKICDV